MLVLSLSWKWMKLVTILTTCMYNTDTSHMWKGWVPYINRFTSPGALYPCHLYTHTLTVSPQTPPPSPAIRTEIESTLLSQSLQHNTYYKLMLIHHTITRAASLFTRTGLAPALQQARSTLLTFSLPWSLPSCWAYALCYVSKLDLW
jgi:hypothetical protein